MKDPSKRIQNWSGPIGRDEHEPTICSCVREFSAVVAYLKRLKSGKDAVDEKGEPDWQERRAVIFMQKHLREGCSQCQEFVDHQQANEYPLLFGTRE